MPDFLSIFRTTTSKNHVWVAKGTLVYICDPKWSTDCDPPWNTKVYHNKLVNELENCMARIGYERTTNTEKTLQYFILHLANIIKSNYNYNHTIDCNRQCTVYGVIL